MHFIQKIYLLSGRMFVLFLSPSQPPAEKRTEIESMS